ncbi:MAG: hypothetical protein ABSF29_02235 [Tepidisphaeraceae bacterium]|jgi:hypothetical protein
MVHLFLNTYRDASPQRNAELDEAMRRNRDCPHIDKIHRITEPARPTIREMLAIARKRIGWADIAILANSDIYFDQTAALLHYIGYEECFALARYEGQQSQEICFNPHGSQDAWIFRGPPPDVAADFPLGLNGVDSRFGRLLQECGLSVYNPSRSIKTHHIHGSAIRPARGEAEKIPGPYAYFPPCGLEQIRHRSTDLIEKPGRLAIVLPGGLGQIVNVLPIAMDLHRKGHEIFWYVSLEFAPLLEGASYVTPVILDGAINAPEAAVDAARAGGFDQVLDFHTDAWQRGGYAEKFHILPCVLDRPQPPPPQWKPAGNKPILAYSLGALGLPLTHWIKVEFAADFSLLDLAEWKWRPDSLAVVLSETAVCVGSDRFALEMAYAAGTPAVAITPFGTEPRRNWIEHLEDAQAATVEGRAKIAAALRAVLQGTIEPGKFIRWPGGEPPRFGQVRSLSILIAAQPSQEPELKILLDRLVPQLKGHEDVEILRAMDQGDTKLWERRNELLRLANGEYCCFVDVGDGVGGNFIPAIAGALRDRPDCVRFKFGMSCRGVGRACPVKTDIARKIGFGPSGDEEYARKLADSGLIKSESFIDADVSSGA